MKKEAIEELLNYKTKVMAKGIYAKCDGCKRWTLGCELDGNFRRACVARDYKWFVPLRQVS